MEFKIAVALCSFILTFLILLAIELLKGKLWDVMASRYREWNKVTLEEVEDE